MKKKSRVAKIYKKKNKTKKYKKKIYWLVGGIVSSLIICAILFGCEFCDDNEIYNKIADFLISIISSLAIGCITGLIVYTLPKYKKENIDYIEKNLHYLKEFRQNFKLIPKECNMNEIDSIIISEKDFINNFIGFMKEKYVSEDVNEDFDFDDFATLELFGFVFNKLAGDYINAKRGAEICLRLKLPNNFYIDVESFMIFKDKIDKKGFGSLNDEERKQLKDSYNYIVLNISCAFDSAINRLEKMYSKLQD